MYLFLLFSVPLYLLQLAHDHSVAGLRDQHRSLIRGILWGLCAGIVLLIISLSNEPRVAPGPLYTHGLVLYSLIPFFFAYLPLLPYCSKKRSTVEPIFFKVQLAGFYATFHVAIYLVHHAKVDQFLFLYLPLFYALSIPVLGTGLWRSRRFELHWNILSFFLLLLVVFALPFVLVFHEMLLPLSGWLVGLLVLLFMMLFHRFHDYLEQGIRFRFNLETKMAAFVRFFSRLFSR